MAQAISGDIVIMNTYTPEEMMGRGQTSSRYPMVLISWEYVRAEL